MRRTLVLYLPCAALIVAGWLNVERPASGAGRAILLAGLAVVPALLGPRWLRGGALVGAALAGAWIALRASPVQAPQDFFSAVGSRFGTGVEHFYKVTLPLDPARNPHMQEAMLTGVFLFCLALGLAIAARRPLTAALVLVLGAAWPVTLLPGHAAIVRGGLILAACLLLLAGMREHTRARPLPALVLAGIVLAAALASATTAAVAKPELVHWQGWRVGSSNQAVSVAFVWNSNYGGLNWPRTTTTVLQVKAGPVRRYWRATTLDAFRGGHWIAALSSAAPVAGNFNGLDELATVGSIPPPARHPNRWIRQAVTVENLSDRHLIAAAVPVAFAHPGIPAVTYQRGGVALAAQALPPGTSYIAWSYAAHPSARALEASPPRYPAGVQRDDLGIWPGVTAPPFGLPARDALLRARMRATGVPKAYAHVYRAARAVVGHARTPYAAVVALEWWLREAGGFVYDEHPPLAHGVPQLVNFLQTRRGYCQHFAGAMALMLRYLGIPARVAVGFTSGRYDAKTHAWTVTDRDAHAWVEAWFRGYGWLPFDPTPGRGTLGASYSASSPLFHAAATAALVAGAPKVRQLFEQSAKTPLLFHPKRPLPGDPTPAAAHPAPKHSKGTSTAGLIALVLLGVVSGILVFKSLRARLRYLTRDPRRLGSAYRLELLEYLTDQRLALPPNPTLGEVARVLRHDLGVSADSFAAAAARARFGSPAESEPAATLARRELRQVLADLRRRLTLLERVRGAVSLRSLRVS